jgi:hypothetical protein
VPPLPDVIDLPALPVLGDAVEETGQAATQAVDGQAAETAAAVEETVDAVDEASSGPVPPISLP